MKWREQLYRYQIPSLRFSLTLRLRKHTKHGIEIDMVATRRRRTNENTRIENGREREHLQ